MNAKEMEMDSMEMDNRFANEMRSGVRKIKDWRSAKEAVGADPYESVHFLTPDQLSRMASILWPQEKKEEAPSLGKLLRDQQAAMQAACGVKEVQPKVSAAAVRAAMEAGVKALTGLTLAELYRVTDPNAAMLARDEKPMTAPVPAAPKAPRVLPHWSQFSPDLRPSSHLVDPCHALAVNKETK